MVRKHQQTQEHQPKNNHPNERNDFDDAEDEMLGAPEQPVVGHTDDECDEQDEVHTWF